MRNMRNTLVRLVAVLTILGGLTAQASQAQQTPTRPGGRGPSAADARRTPAPKQPTTRRKAEERPAARRPSASRSGGGASAEVSVSTGQAAGAASRVVAPKEPFEPILHNPVVYGELPSVEKGITLSLVGPMAATEFLDALSLATGWNIAASAEVKDLVFQFWTSEVSPKQAVSILKFNNIYYEFDKVANFLFVMTRDEYLQREYGSVVQREFQIEHAALQDIEAVVTSLMSPSGRLIVDPRMSKLIVQDTSDNIEHMARIVEEMDRPRVTRVFELIYADAESLTPSVEALLTEGGSMNVDARGNTLVVTDRPERLERIAEVVSLLDHELETRSWVLDYADPIEVAENIEQLVPEPMGSIIVNEGIHQITVTATPYRLREIDQRIEVWDEKRQQVQIEAYLATASRNILRDLGIDWKYVASIEGNPLTIEVGSVGTDDGNGGIDIGSLAGSQRISFITNNLAAVIDTLDTSADATILAHPRITVQDGEEAVFENTTQVPFASSTTTFGGNQTSLVNTNTRIEFIDVGTILRVTPRITSDDNVLLDIAAEDSSFETVTILANGQENTLPQKTQNKAQTQVLVHDQDTIVLGGLRTTNFSDTVDRVPFLGGLPLIGRVFRNTEKDHLDRELLIFLTPTIVGQGTQAESVRLAALDEEVAQTMRRDAKTTLGRLREKLDRGKHEISVSVGQTGGLLAEGESLTMEALRRLLEETRHPASKKVVIREHPRAPERVASEVAEIAMERGMKVEFDSTRFPFVPSVSTKGAESSVK